jgi:hypothetical protein
VAGCPRRARHHTIRTLPAFRLGLTVVENREQDSADLAPVSGNAGKVCAAVLNGRAS